MKSNVNINTDDENGCVKIKKGKVWKFIHHEDYTHDITLLQNRVCDFKWLSISKSGAITVKGSGKNGYAWDGCTPKINAFHVTWGTFDGKLHRFNKADYKPYTYYASMIHDVLYQYKKCVPVTRKEADRIFYILLKNEGFMWARTYYVLVRLFGWWFSGWKYKTTKEIEQGIKNKASN